MGDWQKYLQQGEQSHLFVHLSQNMWRALPNEHLWTKTISKRLLQLMHAGVVKSESMDNDNSVVLVQRI